MPLVVDHLRKLRPVQRRQFQRSQARAGRALHQPRNRLIVERGEHFGRERGKPPPQPSVTGGRAFQPPPQCTRDINRLQPLHDDRRSQEIALQEGGETVADPVLVRSEEHTSELQSLMRISYAVFCLKKKTKNTQKTTYAHSTPTQKE